MSAQQAKKRSRRDSLDSALGDLLLEAEPEGWASSSGGLEVNAFEPSFDAGFEAVHVSPRVAANDPAPAADTVDDRVDHVGGRPDERPTIDRRNAERVPLHTKLTRATVHTEPGQPPGRGRVVNISRGGGLLIEAHALLPFKADVIVDMLRANGRFISFAGRVVRRPDDTGMAIQMRVPDSARDFICRFIDDALDPEESTCTVTIRPSRPESNVVISLSQAWNRIEERPSDEALHQAFIELSMSSHQIDFALERYRGMKAALPSDPRPDRYLEQLGKILGFYALNKRPSVAVDTKVRFPMPLRVMSAAAAALLVLFLVLTLKS